jgi:cell division transport system ATP-binding protein
LQLDGVSLRYGDAPTVLHGINLKLNAGSFHFLSGPTGAGKTSLLRLISLSLPPSSGSIRVFGREIDKINRDELAGLRQRIGVVFQDFRLLEHLSAFDNVALPLRINGANEDETVRFVADMLGWLGIDEKLEVMPKDLSMGQRQMVCIARAVVAKPRLLLADEPTSNIDAASAERLMSLFVQMHKLGTAVLLATHNEALMDRHPHPILRLSAGRLTVPVAEPTASGSTGRQQATDEMGQGGTRQTDAESGLEPNTSRRGAKS